MINRLIEYNTHCYIPLSLFQITTQQNSGPLGWIIIHSRACEYNNNTRLINIKYLTMLTSNGLGLSGYPLFTTLA